MTSVLGQWQNGKQVAIWPADVANGSMVLPPRGQAGGPVVRPGRAL